MIEQIITIIGGTAVCVAAAAWLAKAVITQFLTRDIENHKVRLSAEAQTEIEKLKAHLSSTSQTEIERLNAQLARRRRLRSNG